MSSALLGSNRVSEAEVINVPDVPFTRTFHPVHHRDVIRLVREGLQAVGLEVTRSEYVLAAEGMRMFGVYDLSYSNGELCWSIGIRNSLNKSMSLGITAGTRVFVCENLCFSGEFLAFRRHTAGLDLDELAFLAYKSVKKMIPLLKAFQAWHEGLHGFPLTEADAKILMVEVMTQNVLPPSKFHQFRGLYGNVYDDSLWGFHEAATDVLKEANLLVLPQKNKLLNDIINGFIGARDEQPSALGEFFERRAAMYR
jgi:hypothetical protein